MRDRTFLTTAMVAAGLLLALPGMAREARINQPDSQAPSPFLVQDTRVRAVVSGPVAQVTVTQRWENPNAVPVDGLYIFPLPEDAAVHDLTLTVGSRVIGSSMMRRAQARALYEQARQEGRMAGLLDQERPNVFAQQVAHLPPGVPVEVKISFDAPVTCESGTCSYVFPTVVGPRFIPAGLPDPGVIDPPVVPEGSETGQRLDLEVLVDAGLSVDGVHSPSHGIRVQRDGETRFTAVLGRTSLLKRDFVLRWQIGSLEPEVGLLAFRDPDFAGPAGVFSLILQPPLKVDPGQAQPRELVFVLDCSGSMSGVPLDAARSVVRQALRAARPQDTFRIIRFSERASGLGEDSLAATPANIRRALEYLDGLQGQGGTHMMAGVEAALAPAVEPGRLRVVAFLTDGYIGNETQVLAAVAARIGEARLFSLGIGSSVNRYLLEGLAEEGRGAAAFLGPRETPEALVQRFVARIDRPVLSDIKVTWDGVEVQDLEPGRLPDLFAGQPLRILGRYLTPGSGVVEVEGWRRGRRESFRQVIHLPQVALDHGALGRLWARARIHGLERAMHGGKRPDLRESVIDLSLTYRLMTRWTSLVAVDSRVTSWGGPNPVLDVPVEMPEGVSHQGVFGLAPGRSRGKVDALALSASPMPAPPAAASKNKTVASVAAREERLADARDENEGDGDDAVAARAWEQVTWTLPDGRRVEFTSGGEVWTITAAGRRQVERLTPEELAELAALVDRAWRRLESGSPHGAGVTVRTGSSTLHLPADAGGQDSAALRAWLARRAAGL